MFWGILTFSILVVIHEMGHFVAARLFKIRVHEFMVGLPGPAIRYHGKQTAYGITAIPLGGYVKIAGMEPGPEDDLLPDALKAAMTADVISIDNLANDLGIDKDHSLGLLYTLTDWGALKPSEDNADEYALVIEPEPGEDADTFFARVRRGTYRGVSTWKRITILSMGVIVNLITAIVVFTIVLSTWGYFTQSLTLDAVLEGEAAAAAGLRAGDTLTTFDGEPVEDWAQLVPAIESHDPGATVVVGYERNRQPGKATVILGESEFGTAYLGVQASIEHIEIGIFAAMVESIKWTGLVFAAIVAFFNPQTFQQSMEGARGVVGISIEAAKAVENGPLDYAWLVALLSLSLGVMNILPIPPLDGGKVLLEIIEKFRGRPLDRSITLGVSLAGALLLFSFIGYVMYADFVRYF